MQFLIFSTLLLTVVFALLLTSSQHGVNAHGVSTTSDHHLDNHHTCIHDTHIIPFLKEEDKTFPGGKRPTYQQYHNISSSSSNSDRSAQSQSVAPIRIVARTDSLYKNGKYCATSVGTVDDQLGGKAKCNADTVLTEEKRNILTQKLLPAAFAQLSKYLQVIPVTEPIKVPDSVCKLYDRSPADWEVGVSNADIVVYVSAAPTDGGEDWASTYAWAASCMIDDAGRPVIGKANFSPKFLKWDPYDEAKNRIYVQSAVHELLHLLGFSYYVFLKEPLVTDFQIRGKPTHIYKGSKATARYRAFSGCSSAQGVEIEDQPIQSDGSIDSRSGHWERRNLADSIMVGAAGGTMAIDEMTLAAFEDSGFYSIRDYSLAEKMTWGAGAGCSFLTEKCGPSSPQLGTYWCQEKADETCTFDSKGYGVCSVIEHRQDIFPAYFQYFSGDAKKGGPSQDFMDYCSSIVPYRSARCNSPDLSADASGVQMGEIFGIRGRCIKVDDLAVKNVAVHSEWPGVRCVLMRCPFGKRLQLKLQTGNWFDCPKSGEEGWISSPSGYQGRIFCPKASTVCDNEPDLYLDNDGTDADGSETVPPPATTATPSPDEKPPTAALVITVLNVKNPFNETYYKQQVQEITAASFSEMKVSVDSSGENKIRVEFTGASAPLYTNRLVTAPLAQLRLSGFSNATAIDDGNGNQNNAPASPSGGGESLSWLPFPLYIFLAITIGGGLLLILIICCVCIQCRRRRSGQDHFDSESGSQNSAKQYKAWSGGEVDADGESMNEMNKKNQEGNNNNNNNAGGTFNMGQKKLANEPEEDAQVLVPKKSHAPAPKASPAAAGNAKRPAGKKSITSATATATRPTSSSTTVRPTQQVVNQRPAAKSASARRLEIINDEYV